MGPIIKSVESTGNPVLGPEDGVPNYVMLWVQHPPGGASAQHTHPWEHQAYIVEGEGVLWVEGNTHPIKAGDAVLVPPDVEHQFRNHRHGHAESCDRKPVVLGGRRVAACRELTTGVDCPRTNRSAGRITSGRTGST